MNIDRQFFESLLFKRHQPVQRFTQDSPVYPSVWLEYFDHRSEIKTYRADLLLTPHNKSSAAELFQILSQRLRRRKNIEFPDHDPKWEMATNGESVVAKLTLQELAGVVLPLTPWWINNRVEKASRQNDNFHWFRQLVGAIYYKGDGAPSWNDREAINNWLGRLEENYLMHIKPLKPHSFGAPTALWSVNQNRRATLSIAKSVPATKADAGRRLFDIDGSGISWAIMDSGIDACHPAFRKKDRDGKLYEDAMGEPDDPYSNHTRITATYDFTDFRKVVTRVFLSGGELGPTQDIIKASGDKYDQALPQQQIDSHLKQIEYNLAHGMQLDWSLLAPLLRMPHNHQDYRAPEHPHGTHVAGILGANLVTDNGYGNLIGMCPGIEIYDIRVMDKDGGAEEFNILAAIHFIRWLNSQKDRLAVHGVNMSFSLLHEVASYACGQTPVCVACERLVAEGTVVVVAAGNYGQSLFQATDGSFAQGFRMVNITDPGNAENVITVGATHRNEPHTYGVSYFSSKGPTGDGRVKPDLVAPGEKIFSASLNNGDEPMDGTSMAAPHVSGAAALILAKHNELIGRPRKIKDILCRTATDLGREKYFQGCGMLDVLRAIQSV